MTDNLPYRPCVGICLFNNEGLVFVGERIDTPGAWQMPQGGIDPDEDIEKAALRELEEETGVSSAEILKIGEEKIRYDLPKELLGFEDEKKCLWEGKFRGQEQIWVAMRFTGQDNEINLNNYEEPEFSNWEWVEFEQVTDRIVAFKQETYRQVIKMFKDIAA